MYFPPKFEFLNSYFMLFWVLFYPKDVLMLIYLFFQTYCVDNQTPDSACTASAIFSGVKTNYDTLGYDSTVEKDNPASVTSSNEVTTVLKWAQESGRNTGNSLVLPK